MNSSTPICTSKVICSTPYFPHALATSASQLWEMGDLTPCFVNANFKAWPAQSGTSFTPEQLHWLEMIRDHIAANFGIEPDDFGL